MTDDALLSSELWRQIGLIRRLRLEREDLAQDVRLSWIKRPLTGTEPAHRRLEIRSRLIDVLRVNGARLRGGRYTGVKGQFNLMPMWADLSLSDPSYAPNTPDPWLAAHVDALPERQQTTIRALFWGDQTMPEVAQTLGCSPQRVWQHKTEGLRALRQALEGRS